MAGDLREEARHQMLDALSTLGTASVVGQYQPENATYCVLLRLWHQFLGSTDRSNLMEGWRSREH